MLAYALVVENNGPEIATGVGLVDILSSEVSFVSADASQGNCSQADGVVSCSLGALQPGVMAAAEIKVLVDPATAGVLFPAAGNLTPANTQTIINSALVQSSSVDFKMTTTLPRSRQPSWGAVESKSICR